MMRLYQKTAQRLFAIAIPSLAALIVLSHIFLGYYSFSQGDILYTGILTKDHFLGDLMAAHFSHATGRFSGISLEYFIFKTGLFPYATNMAVTISLMLFCFVLSLLLARVNGSASKAVLL